MDLPRDGLATRLLFADQPPSGITQLASIIARDQTIGFQPFAGLLPVLADPSPCGFAYLDETQVTGFAVVSLTFAQVVRRGSLGV